MRPRNPNIRYHKLERPKLTRAKTTLWEYASANYGKGRQGDTSYRGQTPSFVIWQLLERYTKRGDVILDPFCGSGTSIDVCKDLGREARGFDIAPYREDIGAADARDLPLKNGSVDLAFFDPPYADNLRYSDSAYCIGKTRAQDGSWHQAMEDVCDELGRVVRKGGIIAGFVQDIMKPGAFFPLGLDLANIMRQRFVFVDHVSVARKNKKLHDQREHQKTVNKLARGYNHLLIFSNVSPDEQVSARRNRPGGKADNKSTGKPGRSSGRTSSSKKRRPTQEKSTQRKSTPRKPNQGKPTMIKSKQAGKSDNTRTSDKRRVVKKKRKPKEKR